MDAHDRVVQPARARRLGLSREYRLEAVACAVEEHVLDVGALVRKYADVPMSVVAVRLMRMSAVTPHSAALTLDGIPTLPGRSPTRAR